ncbi:MAG: head decoration protein [Alphaproteobacteria bacterium]
MIEPAQASIDTAAIYAARNQNVRWDDPMLELREGQHAGEFIVSEGNGTISRETITALSGETLEAGAALGKVTASGKYKALDPVAVDGSEVAAAILYDAVGASAAEAVAILRLAEVHAEDLVWPHGIAAGEKTTALGELAVLTIIAY